MPVCPLGCAIAAQLIGCDLEAKVFVYLDDIIVATESLEEHFEVLDKIACRLKSAGLTISSEKSRFCMKTLKYLGYIVGENGISTDPDKLESIVNYTRPKSVSDVQRLLEVVGWYRRFIKNFESKGSRRPFG